MIFILAVVTLNRTKEIVFLSQNKNKNKPILKLKFKFI